MAVKDSLRKVDSTVERKHSCMSSVEIVILTLKEHMATFLQDTTPERISPTMIGKWKISVEINAVSFKEMITGTLSVRILDD